MGQVTKAEYCRSLADTVLLSAHEYEQVARTVIGAARGQIPGGAPEEVLFADIRDLSGANAIALTRLSRQLAMIGFGTDQAERAVFELLRALAESFVLLSAVYRVSDCHSEPVIARSELSRALVSEPVLSWLQRHGSREHTQLLARVRPPVPGEG